MLATAKAYYLWYFKDDWRFRNKAKININSKIHQGTSRKKKKSQSIESFHGKWLSFAYGKKHVFSCTERNFHFELFHLQFFHQKLFTFFFFTTRAGAAKKEEIAKKIAIYFNKVFLAFLFPFFVSFLEYHD